VTTQPSMTDLLARLDTQPIPPHCQCLPATPAAPRVYCDDCLRTALDSQP
jgi:hypothetical protein